MWPPGLLVFVSRSKRVCSGSFLFASFCLVGFAFGVFNDGGAVFLFKDKSNTYPLQKFGEVGQRGGAKGVTSSCLGPAPSRPS